MSILGNDWDKDIILDISRLLSQSELVSFCLTCKVWTAIGRETLYSKLYITEGPPKDAEKLNYPCYKSSTGSCSVLMNSLWDKNCSLKRFEQSLTKSPYLASLIRSIFVDDMVFVLFKLQGWGNKYFHSTACNLQEVEFCNIPVTHFLIAHDSLFAFYQNHALLDLLINLQLGNFQELVSLCHFAKANRIKLNVTKLSFYLPDRFPIESIHFDVCVKALFSDLQKLQVHSVDKEGLRFLKKLGLLYGEKCFPDVRELSLNSSHGKGQQLDPTDSKVDAEALFSLFNALKFNRLELKIGCSHVVLPARTESMMDFETLYESDALSCTCLPVFFQKLETLLRECNIRQIRIERQGPSVLMNPYSCYHFKKLLADFLPSAKKTVKEVSVDTRFELAPLSMKDSHEVFKSMVKVNEEILRQLESMELDKLAIVDYLEGYELWKEAKDHKSPGLFAFMATHCSECAQTYQNIERFIAVNQQIQFYLNPTFTKTNDEFYYDVFRCLLNILRNPTLASIVLNDRNTGGSIYSRSTERKHDLRSDNFIEPNEIIAHSNRDTDSKNLSLHDIFRHDNYKELVTYNGFCQATPKQHVTCGCQGDELTRFVSMLRHNVKFSSSFPTDTQCNGLSRAHI